MENKLQQLTQKLYEEGLEKGRSEAVKLVSDAQAEAGRIVARAQAEAAKITEEAARKAEETARNARTEMSLAVRQSLASLREMIGEAVSAHTLEAPVKGLSMDAPFVGEMLMEVVRHWAAAGQGRPELTALLPAAMQEKFEQALKGSLAGLLAGGVELKYSDGVPSGFHIGPRDGGYHISFTEDDLRALLENYLRPKTAELLYAAE